MGRTISVKIRPLNKVCAVSLSINAVIKVVSSNMPHAITVISAAAFLNFFINRCKDTRIFSCEENFQYPSFLLPHCTLLPFLFVWLLVGV